MQLWIATNLENKAIKLAASSRPNLQEIMKVPGKYVVKRVDIGDVNKLKVCQLYMQKKKVVETILEKMILIVDDEGNVRKKRTKRE
jgi:hypothetical protein